MEMDDTSQFENGEDEHLYSDDLMCNNVDSWFISSIANAIQTENNMEIEDYLEKAKAE